MDIVSLGMPFGLAFASGLNAYLPLLAFTISVRWLHLYKVNPNFAFVTSNWFMALLALLTILDFVADKVPLIDHGWDAVHTIIRPIAGAVVAAAAGTNAFSAMHISTAISSSHTSTRTVVALSAIPLAAIGPFLLLLIGGGLAALSHTAKATTRLVSTLTTAGIFNIGLSALEDIAVIIMILLSLFASTIMFILLILLIIIIVPQIIRYRR